MHSSTAERHYSIFLRSDAEYLGIELPRLPNQRIAFGSGAGLGRRVKPHLELGGQRFRADVVFVDDEDWPSTLPYALLGRTGVFPRFHYVAFMERLPTPVVEFQR